MFHAWCEVTKYHFVQTDPSKTILARGIKSLLAHIDRQYTTQRNGIKVRQIHGDQDTVTHSKDFKQFIENKGIRFTASAPYTPQQNGPAERAGGLLTQFARALKIDSGLPDSLWVELYLTAAHIINLTPTKSLGWENPTQQLYKVNNRKDLPDISHLRIVGSKAYVRIPTTNKGDKINSRAKIGWLIGFEATNIWRIWIPDLERVVCTRDVTFDETTRYKSDAAAMKLADKRSLANLIETVQIPEPANINVDEQEEDEMTIFEDDMPSSIPADNNEVEHFYGNLEPTQTEQARQERQNPMPHHSDDRLEISTAPIYPETSEDESQHDQENPSVEENRNENGPRTPEGTPPSMAIQSNPLTSDHHIPGAFPNTTKGPSPVNKRVMSAPSTRMEPQPEPAIHALPKKEAFVRTGQRSSVREKLEKVRSDNQKRGQLEKIRAQKIEEQLGKE